MKIKFLICLFFLSSSVFGQSVKTEESVLKAELYNQLEKTGSSYYAYPGPLRVGYTPAPVGYSPVYLSHYGRHGSRWLTEDARYEAVLKLFDSYPLTPYGHEIRERLEIVWQDAKGCSGDLTPVGERQHHDIAVRMYQSYPSIFANHAQITAEASTSRRCMMSMMAFCEGLKEQNSLLQITRSAHERDMVYINYESAELKQFTSKKGLWWTEVFTPFIRKTVDPTRLMKTLFVEQPTTDEAYDLFDGLYWIASDMQNVELGDLSFYDMFTPAEMYAYWTCQNLKMYVTNGPAPVNKGVTSASSKNLLDKIVEQADKALSSGVPTANLRFGHDSALIRLLTLMKIEECSAVTADDGKVATVWQDFRITPMAANLQLVFYKNNKGNVLVKFLMNENEVRLPIVGESGPYYDWNKVKNLWGY